MTDSISIVPPDSRNDLSLLKPEEKAIDTLTAFVRDAEHDLLSVVTALQAHIDLLYEEQISNHMPVDRFAVLNRSIARLIADTTVLASVSELALAPRSKQKLLLEGLMQEIAAETRSAFSSSQVSLSCEIATGTTLFGNAGSLKVMIKGMVLTVLHKCHKLETVRIVGLTHKKRVSLSFDIGLEAYEGAFEPWQLGELRLIPTNGEGIRLAAVDAMARLQHGQLSVCTAPDLRPRYRLTFRV
jgi:hypothetical protein